MSDEKVRYIHPDIAKKDISDEEKEKQEQKRRKALRNEITHKLRFEILERDKSVCQICGVKMGQKMANNEDCKLEIDHKKPLDLGGDNSPENLWTLCWVCNEGKKSTAFTPPKRVYELNKQKVIEIAESSNFEEMQMYLEDANNEEERQWLYERNRELNHPYCQKNCTECIKGGNWYYRRCFVILHSKVTQESQAVVERINSESTELTVASSLPTLRGSIPVISNSKDTKMGCDFCYVSQRCQQFKVGAECAYDFKNGQDLSDAEYTLKLLANIQAERVMRSSFFEKKDGGAIDKNVSGEIGLLRNILVDLKNLNAPPPESINISAQGGKAVGSLKEMLTNALVGESKEIKNKSAKNKNIDDATIIE